MSDDIKDMEYGTSYRRITQRILEIWNRCLETASKKAKEKIT
jgi:hypothetical protein